MMNIPEGQSGDWKIEHFTVSDGDQSLALFNLRTAISGGGRRSMKAGHYSRLMRGCEVIMSDTPAEIMDHSGFIWRATGDVLINGLGLGYCASKVLEKTDVRSVTVIERSPDVIALVAPHIADDRLTVIEADALEYQPPKGQRYNAVWHDIWDAICADNLDEMKALHRKYGRRTDWQGSWCRDECEYHDRQNRRMYG